MKESESMNTNTVKRVMINNGARIKKKRSSKLRTLADKKSLGYFESMRDKY